MTTRSAPGGRSSMSASRPHAVLSANPWVHFGIGLVVVAVLALSAVPEIERQRRRTATSVDSVVVSASSEGLFVLFAVVDSDGADMATPGTVDLVIASTDLDPLGTLSPSVPLSYFRTPITRDQFVPALIDGDSRLMCQLDGIAYSTSDRLSLASREFCFVRAELVFTPQGGGPMNAMSHPVPLGDPDVLFGSPM